MNTENSKTSEPHRFKLDLTVKFKSAPTWNDTFDLPDGSYSSADISDYFEFIIKKHETLTEIPRLKFIQTK